MKRKISKITTHLVHCAGITSVRFLAVLVLVSIISTMPSAVQPVVALPDSDQAAVGTHYPEAWSNDGTSIIVGSCPRSPDFAAGAWNHEVAMLYEPENAQNDTWHVATDGSDETGNGSEANPFATIQRGIDVANTGDTVLVHPGTYTENIDFNGKNITVASLFQTTGDEAYISQTVIDGNQNGSVVTFENGEGPTAVLSGFTITHGDAHGAWPYQSGGGIIVYDAAPHLHHLDITNNSAIGEGGGIYLAQNQSGQDVARVSHCTISDNSAGGDGGGIRFSSDNKKVAVVESSFITGNTAPVGGGVHIYHSGILENCLITHNTATNVAGAVYVDWGSSYKGEPGTFITNCTIANNSAPTHGGLDYIINGAIVKNTIIYNNSNGNWRGGSYTHCCTLPVPSGEGNIGDDPLFVDAEHDDYHLSDNSPCIGAGTLTGAPTADIEGKTRPYPAGSNPDIGAYEHPRITLTISPLHTVTLDSLVYVPVRLEDVTSADDVRGVQFSLQVTDTAVLTPAGDTPVLLGDLFPSESYTYTVPTEDGWDLVLNAPLSPTAAISGTGVVAEFPFYAQGVGCVGLNFGIHLVVNGKAQAVDHRVIPGRICVLNVGDLVGTTYLQSRESGHYTDTLVVLEDPAGRFTTTDASGAFALTDVPVGTYTTHFTRTLFVHAVREIIVAAGITTTMSEAGLWAGDLDQDGDVQQRDWYICAAASIPVSDPAFDINDDGITNVRDCTILASNIGRPDMPTTDPPKGSFSSQGYDAKHLVATQSQEAHLELVPRDSRDILLRVVGVNQVIHAVGTRLSIPVGATVSDVNLEGLFTGGFLSWHQGGDTLYIVAAPPEDALATQDTDIALIHIVGADAGGVEIEATNIIAPRYSIFLPTVIRNVSP